MTGAHKVDFPSPRSKKGFDEFLGTECFGFLQRKMF
jgi:hypothetical protein